MTEDHDRESGAVGRHRLDSGFPRDPPGSRDVRLLYQGLIKVSLAVQVPRETRARNGRAHEAEVGQPSLFLLYYVSDLHIDPAVAVARHRGEYACGGAAGQGPAANGHRGYSGSGPELERAGSPANRAAGNCLVRLLVAHTNSLHDQSPFLPAWHGSGRSDIHPA
jgi:hypothetical protein